MNVIQFIRILVTITAVVLTAPFVVAQGNGGGHGNGGGGGGGSTSYSIIKLDDVGGTQEGFAYDINDSRLVVGVARNVLGADTAACWTVAKVGKSYTSTLHFLTGGDSALGCNAAGEIVGDGNQTAVYWHNRNSVAQELPWPSGSARCDAQAISNDGVICGWSETFPDDQGRTRISAIAWRVVQGVASDPLELETVAPDPNGEDYVVANDVSQQDVDGVISIVGASNGNAVVWTVTLAENGGLLAGSTTILSNMGYARGTNNLGQVCGRADSDGVVWTEGVAQVLNGYPIDPYDMNDSGVVVGYSGPLPGEAVVWASPSAAKVSLNNFLRNSPFSSLALATAVNTPGDIVGYGWSQSFNRAFLAIPK